MAMLDRSLRHLKALALSMLAFNVVAIPGVTASYPQDALRCSASLMEPDGQLICPEHSVTKSRNGYCVKEMSTLAEEDCGRTSYFGDKWNAQTKQCEYRKCDSSCQESSWDFEFEGETHERYRYCCHHDYCNGATTEGWPRPTLTAWITGLIALIIGQGGSIYQY